MVPIVDAIVKAYNATVQFADGIMKSMDEQKFAAAVNEMYGQDLSSEQWEKAIGLIEKADDIGTEKKIELMKLVWDERDRCKAAELERKAAITAAMNEHTRVKGKVAVDIVTGILSGGVTLIPKAVRQMTEHRAEALPEAGIVIEADEKNADE